MNISFITRWFRFLTPAVRTTRYEILLPLNYNDGASIEAVFEKPGSGKIGHLVPGTRIPILSDNDFPATKHDKPLVNMAWHIAGEIEGYLRGRGFAGDIIHIISPGDFAA